MKNKRIDILIAVGAVLVTVTVVIAHAVKGRAARARAESTSKGLSVLKRKWIQVALVVTAIVSIASMTVGVTLALYSNKPLGESNTFSTGTVSLTDIVTGACASTNMAPSDSVSCTLGTTYAGSLSGYVALDVFVATAKNLATGTWTNLYAPGDPTNEEQLTVSSASPTVNYVVAGATPTSLGTALTSCPNAGASLDGHDYSTGYDKCYQLSNLLVSATALSSGASVTFTTGLALPAAEPNSFQGSSAVVVLAVHAVQSKNNSINCTAGGTSPTAGAVCTPAGSFAWS